MPIKFRVPYRKDRDPPCIMPWRNRTATFAALPYAYIYTFSTLLENGGYFLKPFLRILHAQTKSWIPDTRKEFSCFAASET